MFSAGWILWICLCAWCVQENVEILTKGHLELYDLDHIGCNFVHLLIFLFVIFSSGSIVRAGDGIKVRGNDGRVYFPTFLFRKTELYCCNASNTKESVA